MTDISKEAVEAVARHTHTACKCEFGGMDVSGTLRAQSERIAELEAALDTAQSEARRYAESYPQSSDGRNTFLLLADRIDGLALIPSNPTPEPTSAMFGMGGDNGGALGLAEDAILAAMPDIIRAMVVPLVWRGSNLFKAFVSGPYTVQHEHDGNGVGVWVMGLDALVSEHKTQEEAQSAANAHNAAQIMAGLGL